MAGMRKDKGSPPSALSSAAGVSGSRRRIWVAIFIGIFMGCIFAFLYPTAFFPIPSPHLSNSLNLQMESSSCESPDKINRLKSDIMALSDKNIQLKNQVTELTQKLRLADVGKDHAQEQVMVLGKPYKAGPFGTVKSLRTNPTIMPDDSANPRLAKILTKLDIRKELIVVLANKNLYKILED